MCRCCGRAGRSPPIVAVHVILLLSPPLSLTDVFNYINYGRMGMLHHLNPYTTIPRSSPTATPATRSATGTSC